MNLIIIYLSESSKESHDKPIEELGPGDQVMTANGVSHVCENGGYLVGGRSRMGTQHQYLFEGLHNVVGCSMLRCDVCDAVVVNILGHELAEDVAPRQAYWEPGGSPDPKSVTASDWPNQRLYCCRCDWRLETVSTATKPAPPHDHGDMIMRWQCMGHPELPRYVDGVDQLAVADELLGSPVVEGKKLQAAEDLKLMLGAADAELRVALLALLRETLASGTGLRLSRALAGVSADPASFVAQLATIRASEVRLNEPDGTRYGWTIRDRFSHAVATCITRADAWQTLYRTAMWLFEGTLSRELIRVMNERGPEMVIDALIKSNTALRAPTK